NPRIPVLPKPIWQAIAQSKFIELEEFKKDVLRDKGVSQTQAIISADGTIQLEQQRPNKHITNTLQWLEAFNNYSTAVTTIYNLKSGCRFGYSCKYKHCCESCRATGHSVQQCRNPEAANSRFRQAKQASTLFQRPADKNTSGAKGAAKSN